jgi:hypothetical protein
VSTTPTPVSTPAASAAPVTRSRWTWAVTAVLHLAALVPYAISNLVVEGAAYGAMIALWLAFGAVAVAVHRRWGGLSAAVPGIAVATWFVVLTVGESVLGWSA